MSKVNQIQNAIKECGSGEFQKLADAYLRKKGYERINSLGSVIGANKTRKGQPDTLIPLENGKYVVVEYTTQQENLFEKSTGDLTECFNETKTGVPVAKIQEVVICHTSQLAGKEIHALGEQCQQHGVNFNYFGINTISFDLSQDYPGLAREYLGIEVDTGQVLPVEEFITAYNKNKLATPLDTTFHFREKEIEDTLSALQNGNLVILSGKPGVGKSRLALEICKKFVEAHPEYEARCILFRGPDIFDDLRVHFSEGKAYLILVDDANRVNRFEYFIQLLQHQRQDQRIKVIASVRDYAAEKITEVAKVHGEVAKFDLKPLSDDQIKQFIKDEYGILNSHYLERISEIASGNPRLAVMAAKIAKEKNTLQSIQDVSALYDEYYSSIRRDLQDLANPNLLKVAGIIAFFRVVDRTNEESQREVEAASSMSSSDFWDAVRRLHDMELVDLYENDVVKNSDQVLGTYLFYISVFKDKVLNLSSLLNQFFPRLQHRIRDALYPVVNAFDSEAIITQLRSALEDTWAVLEKSPNEKTMLQLIDLFWFVKPTESLLYIQNLIQQLDEQPANISEIDFEQTAQVSSSILDSLAVFQHADNPSMQVAVSLIFDYLAKRPCDLPQVAHISIKDWSFRPKSSLRGYAVQRAVIEVLLDRSKSGTDEVVSRLLLAVAKEYLHTHFDFSWSKDKHVITITRFDLLPSSPLFELRKLIWDGVFALYQKPDLKGHVLDLLTHYSGSGFLVSVDEIVAKDAASVLPFIQFQLEPTRYRDCVAIHNYFKLLRQHSVPFDEQLPRKFTNDAYKLSELLCEDWAEMRALDLTIQEFELRKQEKIKEHFKEHDFAGYVKFFGDCHAIQAEIDPKSDRFVFQNGVDNVLAALAARDPALYRKVLSHYLELDDPLQLWPLLPVRNLLATTEAEDALKLLKEHSYRTKRRWLFGFFQSLPTSVINGEYVTEMCNLYQTADFQEIPYHFDFLLNYRKEARDIIERVTEIILARTQQNPDFARFLDRVISPHSEIGKQIGDVFERNLGLLKRAYFASLAVDAHLDFDGQLFNHILNRDPNFITEYIDWMYRDQHRPNRYDDGHEYAFLWGRDDYLELVKRTAEHIYAKEKATGAVWSGYLEAFFALEQNSRTSPERVKREDELLSALIQEHHQDQDFMDLVFGIVVEFKAERRKQFYALFLTNNKEFPDFERLPFEPSHGGWSGSAVPMLQGKVDFFQSLLPLVNTVDLLKHKQHVEHFIDGYRNSIERTKKHEFMED